MSIKEKWDFELNTNSSYQVFRTYLNVRYPCNPSDSNLYINGACLPDEFVLNQIQTLPDGHFVSQSGRVLLCKSNITPLPSDPEKLRTLGLTEITEADRFRFIAYPEDIFVRNAEEIDMDLLRKMKKQSFIQASSTNRIISAEGIYIEEGAQAEHAYLNAKNGPVYLSADSIVMEGSMIRGPFYLGPGSEVKMGSKIYGATSIGPHCKVGGEITNSVMFGYSNKGHEGFMGQAIIGHWCNWGAGTNNSNLKNNYDTVKLWDEHLGRFRQTGLQFAGLVMGDHSKTGINTMLNTGTVIGIGANVFGAGYPRNFLPSFCWGGAQGLETFRFDKFSQTAARVMERRKLTFDETEEHIMNAVYEETARQRTWERKDNGHI
jgi:UDP-N-acetylglucosamine diphosphorylase/glucosamine-1-phosphate N-acetyltransferase